MDQPACSLELHSTAIRIGEAIQPGFEPEVDRSHRHPDYRMVLMPRYMNEPILA